MHEEARISEKDTCICAHCVVDNALKKLVNKNLSSKTCDYCGKKSVDPIAALFNVVMQRIFEAISTQYADAQELDVPWIDGGWMTREIYTVDVVGEFDPGWNDKLLDDIIDSLDPMIYWAEHTKGDWSIIDPSLTLIYGWDNFKEQVLTKTRYLFLAQSVDEWDAERPDYIPISSMLSALGKTCHKEGLVKTISKGDTFYRARHASKEDNFKTFSEVGVPPTGVAKAGRMNPAGISYLYLAFEEDTAEKEVLDWSKRWFTAKFRSKIDISIVDFSALPEIPSVFEPDLYDTRQNRRFLHAFRDQLTLPISKDGKEHIDYVPTQIVSEYFRYQFKNDKGNKVLGLKYPSVKNSGGTNLTIFSSNNGELEDIFELIGIQQHDLSK